MTKEEVFQVVKRNLIEILPSLNEININPLKSMKDLGANSIERVDVIIGTMEELNLRFPPHELGGLDNIQSLVDTLHSRCQHRDL